MSQSKLVLVAGATGKQGGACVEALLTRGHQVRALTRNSASPAARRLHQQGVEIAVGDFTDHASLVRAARGVDAVYAMSTPYEQGAEKEIAQGITMADAAKAAGVAHLVYSSVASANRATAFRILTANMKSKSTFKHPASPAPSSPRSTSWRICCSRGCLRAASGKLAMALPASRSLQQIATANIGAFVATVIERGDTVFGRRFDIAGDEVTGKEAAAILSKVTGREVHYEGFPPDVLRPQSEELPLMFEWFDTTGYAADIESLRRDFPEVNWHTFEGWARKQDWTILDQS